VAKTLRQRSRLCNGVIASRIPRLFSVTVPDSKTPFPTLRQCPELCGTVTRSVTPAEDLPHRYDLCDTASGIETPF